MGTGDPLREMIEVISGELELRPLLTIIVAKACELLGADRGSIGLIDEELQVVRIEAVHEMPPGELGSIAEKGRGLAGAVYASGAPVVPERYGALDDPLLTDLADDAVVGMPIKWRGKLIGTFGIGADGPRRFTDEEIETLGLFARHAAVAINNARSFEREKRRAARLRAAIIIGEAALEGDAEKIVTIAKEALKAHLAIDVALVRKGEAAPEGAMLFPLRFDGADYSELAVRSAARLTKEDEETLATFAKQIGLALERASLLQATHAQLEEMRLLYEWSRRASTAMDLNSVVAAYLSYVAARSNYRCDIGLIDVDEEGREGLTIIGRWTQRHGLDHAPMRFLSSDLGVPGSLKDFDLITSPNVHEDLNAPEGLRAIMRDEGGTALASIPLTVQGARIGVIILSSFSAHGWTQEDLLPYHITAGQLAAIIRNRLDHRKLRDNDSRLAALAERRRLARELHDSVSQLIFSMTLVAQSVSSGFERGPAEGEARVARVLEIARLARAEMKALLIELKDPEGEEPASLAAVARAQGLERALRRHRDVAAPAGVDIRFALDGAEGLAPATAEACLRVAQEAIANAARHGSAKRVEVGFAREGASGVFRVDDNGVGIAGDGDVEGSRIGLGSMKSRIAEVGGALALMKSPLGGVRIEVRVPLE